MRRGDVSISSALVRLSLNTKKSSVRLETSYRVLLVALIFYNNEAIWMYEYLRHLIWKSASYVNDQRKCAAIGSDAWRRASLRNNLQCCVVPSATSYFAAMIIRDIREAAWYNIYDDCNNSLVLHHAGCSFIWCVAEMKKSVQ